MKDKVAVQINCPVMSFHSYDDGSGGATIELENSNSFKADFVFFAHPPIFVSISGILEIQFA